jgi:hypothetical protein
VGLFESALKILVVSKTDYSAVILRVFPDCCFTRSTIGLNSTFSGSTLIGGGMESDK